MTWPSFAFCSVRPPTDAARQEVKAGSPDRGLVRIVTHREILSEGIDLAIARTAAAVK